jgi:hypothetical protein
VGQAALDGWAVTGTATSLVQSGRREVHNLPRTVFVVAFRVSALS